MDFRHNPDPYASILALSGEGKKNCEGEAPTKESPSQSRLESHPHAATGPSPSSSPSSSSSHGSDAGMTMGRKGASAAEVRYAAEEADGVPGVSLSVSALPVSGAVRI